MAEKLEKSASTNIVFRRGEQEPLQPKRVSAWLHKLENNFFQDKVMTVSPFRPKGGEVFLHRSERKKDFDYKVDGYSRWKQNGYAHKDETKYDVYKTYNVMKEDPSDITSPNIDFRMDVWVLKNPKSKNCIYKAIHYIGDHLLYKPAPHGNSKTGKIYTRNCKAARDQVKKTLKDTGSCPKKAYEDTNKNIASHNEAFAERQAVDGVRDRIQAQNEKAKLNRENKLLRCDIFSLIEMGRNKELGSFIRKHVVSPYEVVIIAEEQVLVLANKLLKDAKRDPRIPQLLNYDTTFELTDVYVSALVMRNTYLSGDPIFPVAIMLHERKFKEVHEEFFWTVNKYVDLIALEGNVPICCDREKGITYAFEAVIPNVNIIYCWNHIIRDVKFWIESARGKTKDDLKVLTGQIELLLLSETENDFDERYGQYEMMWSQQFKSYANKYLQKDMKNRAAKFRTDAFPAFENKTPTNNLSESMNNIIKNHQKWKILRIDSCVLSMFNLQLNKLNEFNKAHSGLVIGSYVLKLQYQQLTCPFELPNYNMWTEERFVEFFKEGVYQPGMNVEKEENYMQSKQAWAKMACDLGLVKLDAQTKTYTVIGVQNEKRNFLTRRKDGTYTCTCKSTGFCYHRMAVFYANDLEIPDDNCNYSLSLLRKNTKEYKGRGGKKPPKPGDFVLNVQEAPDSDLANIKKETSDISPLASDEEDFESMQNENDFKNTEEILNQIEQMGKAGSQKNDVKLEARESEEELQIPEFVDFELLSDSEEEQAQSRHLYRFEPADAEDLDQSGRVSRPQSAASHISEKSKHPTPTSAHFDWENFNANVVKRTWFTSSNYRTLGKGHYLSDDILNDMLCNIISKFEKEYTISLVSSREISNCFKNPITPSTMRLAARIEALNSDVTLIPMLCSAEKHYIMAAVLWKAKQVVFMNSLDHLPQSLTIYARAVLNFIAASFLVAKLHFRSYEWKFFNDLDAPKQGNGFDCGIMVIFCTYSIVTMQNYIRLSNEDSYRARSWVLNCLINSEDLAILCKGRRVKKTCASYVSEVLPKFAKFANFTANIQKARKNQDILQQLRGTQKNWTICNAKKCQEDTASEWFQVFCVNCRGWFHGVCINVDKNTEDYFLCEHCVEFRNGSNVDAIICE